MTLMLTAWRAVAGAARMAAGAPKAGLARLTRGVAGRRTEMALSALDSRTLSDIGLHRSEILSVAYGSGLDRIRRAAHE